MKIEVEVSELLFEFTSFGQWVNKAESWFHRAGTNVRGVICVDAAGRICNNGWAMMRARDEDAFPVKVYRANDEP